MRKLSHLGHILAITVMVPSSALAVQETMVARIAFSDSLSLSKVNDFKLSPNRPLTPGQYTFSTSGAILDTTHRKLMGTHLASEIAILGTDMQTIDILATNYRSGENIDVSQTVCRYGGSGEKPCALSMQVSSPKGLPLHLGANITVKNNILPSPGKPARFDLVIAYN